MSEMRLSLNEKLNRASVEVLLTEADVALTFVNLATTSKDKSRSNQAVRNARAAYDLIHQKRLQFDFSPYEAQALQAKLGMIKSHLIRLGETFDE